MGVRLLCLKAVGLSSIIHSAADWQRRHSANRRVAHADARKLPEGTELRGWEWISHYLVAKVTPAPMKIDQA